MFNGYVRLRRSIIDHLREGQLTLQEFNIYTLLLMLADSRSGGFMTNARSLEVCVGSQLKDQRINDILVSLHAKGYIRRFYVQGQKGSYPILIHKFQVTSGPQKDWYVDAHNSKDWKTPRLVEESQQIPDMWDSSQREADSQDKQEQEALEAGIFEDAR